jgi:hypothetical protein
MPDGRILVNWERARRNEPLLGIEPREGGYCQLTLTHDRLEGAPKTATSLSGPGWMFVLSGLKTVLETGSPLAES